MLCVHNNTVERHAAVPANVNLEAGLSIGSPKPGDLHAVGPGAGLSVGSPKPDDPAAATIVYTFDDIIAAPIGSAQHRVCECPVTQHHRNRLSPSLMLRFEAGTIPGLLRDAFATGLFPLPRRNIAIKPPPEGSFHWVYKEEACQFVKGRIYTDASRINDDHPDSIRLGWAFVVLNPHNHVVAVARGVPPVLR